MNKILNFKGDHKGLDDYKVQENLMLYGHNTEIKADEANLGKNKIFRFYSVFKRLRLYLMLAAVVLYFLGGFVVQGVLLLLLTLGYCAFEILVQTHSEKKLQELTGSAEVIVRVVRDGKITLIKREEIVQDDLIILQGGENVPADAHILEASNVTADESVFTNLSEPVEKHPGSDGRRDLKLSCVYKGTRILTGILIARVFAIGQDVKINPEVRTVKEIHRTEFEILINKLSVLFTYAAAILLTITAVVSILIAGTEPKLAVESLEAAAPVAVSLLTHLTLTLLPAFSFALCTIPISLSAIVRFYYTNAATKLARKYGEMKSLRALETLNSVTALCLDRDSVIVADHTPLAAESTRNSDMLARISALSCKAEKTGAYANSYEKAISINAAFKHINTKELHKNKLIRSYVPEQDSDYNKIHGNLWEINGAKLLCVKGIPEVILSFCKMPPEQLYPIQQKMAEYAKEGHHVLAVAFANIQDEVDEEGNTIAAQIPETLLSVEYTYLGLMAFSVSINDDVPDAVRNCYRNGVKVIMLTPDNKDSALTIARKAGIKEEGIIVGKKADVVKSLKESGEVVAAFGGGVSREKTCSCIQALELSDVSISLSKNTTPSEWDLKMETLSESTTGSACEVCDFILEENGFAKLSYVFSEARQLHRNVKRCISIALSTFAAIFLFVFVYLITGSSFYPDALLLSLLAVVVIPALTLIFTDNELDLDSKTRASAFIGKGKINKNFLISAGIQGGALFVVMLIMFLIFRSIEGFTSGMLRSIFLTVFTAGSIAMAWVGLSCEKPFYKSCDFSEWKSPPIIITGALLLSLPFAVYFPFVNSAFGLAFINPLWFVLSLVIGGGSQLWFDFIKKRFN